MDDDDVYGSHSVLFERLHNSYRRLAVDKGADIHRADKRQCNSSSTWDAIGH